MPRRMLYASIVLLPRMAKIAERSKENEMEQRSKDSIFKKPARALG